MVDAFLPDAAKVAALREALPATGAGIYLDTATAGPLPTEIIAAARDSEDRDLRTGRAGEGQSDETQQRSEEARGVLAALLAADPDEISLSHGVTEAVTSALWAIDWRPGDELLAVASPGGLEMDAAIRTVALRARVLPLRAEDGPVEGPDPLAALVATVAARIGPRTRAIVLPHVDPERGDVLPVGAIAVAARARGVRTVVDGSAAAGAVPVDVRELGVDAYALPGHRWLLGPEGTGALWVDRDVAWRDDGLPSFESGGFHRPSMVAFARAVGWLEMYVGLPWVHERIAALTHSLADGLAGLDAVTFVTRRERLAGIVTFRIAGWPAQIAVDELSRRAHAIVSARASVGAIRASLGFFITEEEVARFVAAVAELARYTPDTLPRRPSLVVLASGEGAALRRISPDPGGGGEDARG